MSKKLKQIGGILMGIAAITLLITIVGMVVSFRGTTAADSVSASNLANGISTSLIPSAVGGPLFVVGLVLFVVGWWKGRKTRPLATS